MRVPRRLFLKQSGIAAASLALSVRGRASARSDTTVLFDGTPDSLRQWRSVPRLPTPPVAALVSGNESYRTTPEFQAAVAQSSKAKANWTIENGAIVGRQEREDLGLGGYLVTKESFADFELEFEANPDWGSDSGVMVRALPDGNVGIQALVEARDGGGFGGYHGNGFAGFRATPFGLTGVRDSGRKIVDVIEGTRQPADNSKLRFACPFDEFKRVFRIGDWNRFKVRVLGTPPVCTYWMNDLKLSEFDVSSVEHQGVTGGDIAKVLGRQGHIALECHPNGRNNMFNAPGLAVRFRNIRVRRL